MRPPAGFGLCAYTRRVWLPFPAAHGGGILVVRPGTVQARRATSARSFPVTAHRGARYPSRWAPPVGAPSRYGGFLQWFVLPLSSPWSSSRPAQPAPAFQAWRPSSIHEQGIGPQGVAVVGIFVATCDREHAEAQHRRERVHRQRWVAPPLNLARQCLGQAEPAFRVAQQDQPAGRRDQSAGEIGGPNRS